MEKVNIIIAGVGGQGIITMGRILVEAANLSGVKALVSETHGLAQRGGAVNVHVRMGDVYAPLIRRGEADYLVALEATEALRNIEYANRDTIIVLNEMVERSVLPKIKMLSFEEIYEKLTSVGFKVVSVNAKDLAIKAGNPRAMNAVMIGVMMGVGKLKDLIKEDKVMEALRTDVNRKAYLSGKLKIDVIPNI
ncbi:indolepyruvate oxidoreductase subunit beta [Acidianus sulfidivorans JP7]|uniref:Indolepyruvate oxidoreductase n=1 Tax=Acidianus sulfidivorans JP7 TaxID=619593 RepID=A0A2U9IQ25_9CREN|nr:indolepyruvate oxidoreductase subunit beta [Acidianus sulfidivorans]AWR98074.1 indolepyruvate oxidoreductase subunit beta [Acidianus sulfidivorans JP7]